MKSNLTPDDVTSVCNALGITQDVTAMYLKDNKFDSIDTFSFLKDIYDLVDQGFSDYFLVIDSHLDIEELDLLYSKSKNIATMEDNLDFLGDSFPDGFFFQERDNKLYVHFDHNNLYYLINFDSMGRIYQVVMERNFND